MIKLSIIIPFYNVEQYIAQCLDSVYNQDIPECEYEVICVDDCGPDNSRAIVLDYQKKHENLKIVSYLKNRKLGGARNAGVDVAKGEYIWFIDSDDFVEHNVFGILYKTAEDNMLDVLHFNYEWYPDRNNPDNHRIPSTGIMTGADMFFDERFIWFHDLITAWRKLYKRSFLIDNHIQFEENIMYEDNDYSIMVFAHSNRVMHIALFAYNYRSNFQSITRVNITSEHVSYWMNLCHRLIKIKRYLNKPIFDNRFQELLDKFIRYEIHMILENHHKLSQEEKKKSLKIIWKGTNRELRRYMSKKTYLTIKFNLI